MPAKTCRSQPTQWLRGFVLHNALEQVAPLVACPRSERVAAGRSAFGYRRDDFGNEAPVQPRGTKAHCEGANITSSRLERCAGSVRPAWAAFGRLGIAISITVLGATSPAPHAFATTPALHHASMARTGATIAVVNSLASTVTAYGASASRDARPIATLTLGLDIPDCATFDAAGDLWVVNYNGRSVVEYASNAFSGGPQAPERTISSDRSGSLNSPAGCTFDHSGDLWVANDLTNAVVEYAPGTPASGAQVPIATISSDGSDSLSGPVALAFDQSGDLWVANYDNSTVVEYTMSDLASGPRSRRSPSRRTPRARSTARSGLPSTALATCGWLPT